jgi:hypothetical protein
MQPWNLAAYFLSFVLSLPLAATVQESNAKPDLGANAALKYWIAFALLPSLDKGQEKLLEGATKATLDEAALKLIERSQRSRLYLQRGARLPYCDWGLVYDDGIFMVLPYLPKSMTLARLTVLDARHEFEHGQWKAGADDVTALLRLAHHLRMNNLTLGNLVGYAIERMAIEAAAPYLPQLKAAFPETVVAGLEGPTPASLPQIVLLEKRISAEWFIKELKRAEQRKKGSWQDLWKEIFTPREGVDQELQQLPPSFEQAVKMVEDLLPYYDELARLVAMPPKAFDVQYPEFIKKAKAASRLTSFFLPNMDHFVASVRRAQTQMALFKAALAVVRGGPDALKDIRDPFGDGPFEYRALDKGFELKSKLLVKDQPLTLVVGQGKPE